MTISAQEQIDQLAAADPGSYWVVGGPYRTKQQAQEVCARARRSGLAMSTYIIRPGDGNQSATATATPPDAEPDAELQAELQGIVDRARLEFDRAHAFVSDTGPAASYFAFGSQSRGEFEREITALQPPDSTADLAALPDQVNRWESACRNLRGRAEELWSDGTICHEGYRSFIHYLDTGTFSRR